MAINSVSSTPISFTPAINSAPATATSSSQSSTATTSASGSSAYTAQVNQLVSVFANGSTASIADQAQAYYQLTALGTSGTLYRADGNNSNGSDIQILENATTNTDFAKRLFLSKINTTLLVLSKHNQLSREVRHQTARKIS